MAAKGGCVTVTAFSTADGVSGSKARECWSKRIWLELEDEVMVPVGGESGDVVLGYKDGGSWVGRVGLLISVFV